MEDTMDVVHSAVHNVIVSLVVQKKKKFIKPADTYNEVIN